MPAETALGGLPVTGGGVDRPTVADAMLHAPTTSGPRASVGELRALFEDDHLHVALLVEAGRLLAVLERSDLVGASDGDPARGLGTLEGRTVAPDGELEAVRRRMVEQGSRRLAVLDPAGRLLGLLCLKRTGRGFCSDDDVGARARDARGGDTC